MKSDEAIKTARLALEACIAWMVEHGCSHKYTVLRNARKALVARDERRCLTCGKQCPNDCPMDKPGEAKRDDWNQEKYERLTQMMARKGIGQEAFELLADLATSRRLALEAKVVEPSEDLAQYVNELLDFGIEFAGKRCDEDAIRIWNLVKDYVTARDERIRREACEVIRKKSGEYLGMGMASGCAYFNVSELCSEIMGEAKK